MTELFFDENEMAEAFEPIIMNESDLLAMERELRQRMDNVAQYQQNREAEINRINTFYMDAIRGVNMRIEFLQDQIQNFIEHQKENNPSYKPLRNPYVKISIRKTKDLEWVDEEKAQAQLKASMPEFIKVKTVETIDKMELKKKLLWQDGALINPNTGEVLEGVEWQENTHYTYKAVE